MKRKDKQQILENLSLFSNRTFTKKQIDVLLCGCGCPKSMQFWQSLRQNAIEKTSFGSVNVYRFKEITYELFDLIWQDYINTATKYNNTSRQRKEAKMKAKESNERISKTTIYIVEGRLTDEKPYNDRF